MVRHLDQWWMNHRNTFGQLLYTKDLNEYGTPELEQISPQMRALWVSSISNAASESQMAQLAQADSSDAEGGVCVAPSPFWEGIHNATSMLGFPVIGHKPMYMAKSSTQSTAVAPPQTIRVTPNSPCSAIIAAIWAQIANLRTRRQEMLDDAQGGPTNHNLFLANHDIGIPPYGSWNGHIDKYNGDVIGLLRLIRMAKAAGCKVPLAAYIWLTRKTPIKPN